MKKIGFIGVGIMGKSMVRNLMKAGYEVSIYTRTKAKILDVIEEGAVWCDTIRECAENGELLITIVGYPKDVEEVYFGEEGILNHAAAGTYLVDMTTNSPRLAKRIFEAAKERGMKALDAPVTGGDIGAKNGTLTILAGGEKQDYEVCYPVFEAMGKNISYQGAAGSGQHTKMANQIAIAGTIAGACEALVYAEKTGLNQKACLEAISSGAAGSAQMTNVVPRILENDFTPGFFIKHFIKDMKIAREEAQAAGIRLEVLELVLGMYEALARDGKEDMGTQALIKYYQ